MAPFMCIAVLLLGALFQPAGLSSNPGSGVTMKAVRYHEFGEASVLMYEDAPMPSPKNGEVLVKVSAAGVNPVDWKIRSGKYGGRGMTLPITPGYDLSGVVERVGSGVTDFKTGDEVYGFLALSRGGAYAEYCVAQVGELAPKPKKVDHVHAAAVPLAALTAWQALFDQGKLHAGQTVLIHGGAGGVGHFAVQFAKARGARVIATGSEGNQKFLKDLGADETVDYKKQKFEDVVKDVDVVLDTIGGETLERSYGVVKKDGFIVSIVARPDSAKLKAHEIEGANMMVKPNGEQLREIAKLIDEGKVKPYVSDTYKLEDATKAHEKSESGHARGKIVLTVR